MPRLIRDAKLETRTARTRLPIGPKPYFRRLEVGFHLGYRRLSNGGTWIARRLAHDGRYREMRLGLADDTQDADSVSVLDYGQAQKRAREWWQTELRRDEGHNPRTGPLTVADAMADYLVDFERRGGRSAYHTHRAAETHIIPALGAILVAKLSARKIEDWHRGLPEQPALARAKPGRKPNHRKPDKSADGIRKRRATANRILTILKAALNHAWKTGHAVSDDAWRRVTPFKAVDAALVRYLSEVECVRLINACHPAFRNLVGGALLTGCRYSELTSMRVSDFNADAGVLTVRESKAGKPRHVVLTDEGQSLMAKLTSGKLDDDVIFARTDGYPWGKSHQLRPMREASRRAKIKPEVSFHVLRHTHGSILAMRGVPMGVIAAQLGHADTRMTEKHYAHLAPSYIANTIRANFPTFGISDDVGAVPARSTLEKSATWHRP
jgi:integrase